MDLTEENRLAPNSSKAPWPYLFFEPMREGFEKLANTPKSMHDDVFPHVAKATQASIKKVWAGAISREDGREVIEDFTNTPQSLWRDFQKEILALYGGVIPTLKEQKRESRVKVEASEVIEID